METEVLPLGQKGGGGGGGREGGQKDGGGGGQEGVRGEVGQLLQDSACCLTSQPGPDTDTQMYKLYDLLTANIYILNTNKQIIGVVC